MKKRLIAVLVMVLAVAVSAFAGNSKVFFTEFGLSYANMLTPAWAENNTTGVYDTASFDIKAGANIMRWADVYALGSFQVFMDRQAVQQHFTFYPIAAGVRANIFPDWVVYPDLMFEYGVAIANRHIYPVMPPYYINVHTDVSWTARYYSFGLGVNWNVNDISVLSLRIERPSYSNADSSGGEIQVLKLGAAWKLYY